MSSRPLAANSEARMLDELYKAVRDLQDSTKRRMLPAGYEFRLIAGQIAIFRTTDGATEILTSFP